MTRPTPRVLPSLIIIVWAITAGQALGVEQAAAMATETPAPSSRKETPPEQVNPGVADKAAAETSKAKSGHPQGENATDAMPETEVYDSDIGDIMSNQEPDQRPDTAEQATPSDDADKKAGDQASDKRGDPPGAAAATEAEESAPQAVDSDSPPTSTAKSGELAQTDEKVVTPERQKALNEPWRWDWIQKQDHWGFKGMQYKGKYGLLGMHLAGRVITDAGMLAQRDSLDEAYPDFNGPAANLRSALLQLAGYFGPYIVFKVQAELAPNTRGLKDAFVVIQDIPYIANIRLGIGKEPFSLENQTSFKFTTFMERSLMRGLVPGRSFGAMIYNDYLDRRMTLAAGAFFRSASWSDIEFDVSSGVDFAARLTALPHQDNKDNVVHLGISLLERSNDGDAQFRSRPETLLTNTEYVDTGEFDADTTSSIGLEFVWQQGPVTIQAEHTRAFVTTPDSSAILRSGYVSASHILTGETRRYFTSSGTFGNVVPDQPFSWKERNGPGALEVALRVSSIDLNDGAIQGGKERNLTAGLNWYPSKKMRFMVNFIHGNIQSVADGRTNILQGRFQFQY